MWMRCLTLSLLTLSLSACATSQLGRQIGQELSPALTPPAARTEVQAPSGDWCEQMQKLRWPDPNLAAGDLGPTARAPVLRLYIYGEENCPGWNPERR